MSVNGIKIHWLGERLFFHKVRRKVWFTMITTELGLVFIHLIKTFSERDQAVNIIVGNFGVVVNELADLRLETTMEETYGILVIEVVQAATVPFKQGNVLVDRSFLA